MRALRLCSALVALSALVGLGLPSVAYADSGTIRISVLKGGWFIGASGGSGTLTFHGRRYPLSIGGLSAGLVFGASQTYLSGTVSNIRRPSDVAGVYGAVTVSRKILFVQALPAALALIAVWLA